MQMGQPQGLQTRHSSWGRISGMRAGCRLLTNFLESIRSSEAQAVSVTSALCKIVAQLPFQVLNTEQQLLGFASSYLLLKNRKSILQDLSSL